MSLCGIRPGLIHSLRVIVSALHIYHCHRCILPYNPGPYIHLSNMLDMGIEARRPATVLPACIRPRSCISSVPKGPPRLTFRDEAMYAISRPMRALGPSPFTFPCKCQMKVQGVIVLNCCFHVESVAISTSKSTQS